MRVCGDDPHRLIFLAQHVVSRYGMPTMWRDDMLWDALYGATKALPRWRPGGGASLRTFLWHRMSGEVVEGVRARAPVGRRKYAAGVRVEDLPLWEQPPVRADNVAPAVRDPDDGDHSWLPDPAAEAAFDAVDARLTVDALLRVLPRREREVVQRVDLGGELGRDVAADWGVSPAIVTKVRKRALLRMRRELTAA
jgi:DNA-directed RNA polymerase specialized sigma24 family protein